MRMLATVIVLFFSSPTFGNETGLNANALKTAESLRDQAMQGSNAFNIVESLTTEVGPRMGGTNDFDRATDWAQAKFRSLGFDKVWLQPVTFPV